MPTIKNLQTGLTHSLNMAMWDAVWEERCRKEPKKYQHVPFTGMNMTDISIPFVEEDPVPEKVDEIPFVEEEVLSAAPTESIESPVKKRGRPKKLVV